MALAAYHVIGNAITLDSRLNDAGTGIEDIHVVPYEIDSGPAKGQRRSVKIPQSAWNPADVQTAIEQDLAIAHGVAGLRQGGAGM